MTDEMIFWIFSLIAISLIVVYIITLVRQAQKKQWVWFVLTLLFPIVMLVYWIVRPK